MPALQSAAGEGGFPDGQPGRVGDSGAGAPPDVDLSAGLSGEKFSALLKQEFYVSTPSDGVMVLELVEVQDYALPQGEVATDSVRLVFEGAVTFA